MTHFLPLLHGLRVTVLGRTLRSWSNCLPGYTFQIPFYSPEKGKQSHQLQGSEMSARKGIGPRTSQAAFFGVFLFFYVFIYKLRNAGCEPRDMLNSGQVLTHADSGTDSCSIDRQALKLGQRAPKPSPD